MPPRESIPAGEPARLAVMISGGGRTLVNLQDEIEAGRLDARIALVIASKECAGVERALERGLDAFVVRGRIPRARLGAMLEAHAIDLVLLAGYLVKVEIPEGYEGRVLNIHPALLPEFGGAGMHGERVHEAVLKAGKTESGCTVHVCTEEYDEGPVLVQLTCPVAAGDTPETLAARVFELEKKAYPEAVRRVIEGLRGEELRQRHGGTERRQWGMGNGGAG